MTLERKIVVGLGDVKAVIFECRKCHARVSVPAAEEVKVPYACPCGKQWRPDLLEDMPALKYPYQRFCTALHQCKTLQDNDAPFTILLEFEASDFEDKS